ncbi:MAG: hypothetical protein LBN08_03870 [Lactobacillales bacterium]|jgi:hypothetical protein|nr:hypothetical protein [Lactobacillales bacterium]
MLENNVTRILAAVALVLLVGGMFLKIQESMPKIMTNYHEYVKNSRLKY